MIFVCRRCQCVTTWTLFFVGLVCSVTQAQERLPLPSEADRKHVAEEVHHPFRTEFEAANDNAAKSSLAKKVLSHASRESDPARRFMTLKLALDIARSADDMDTSVAAVKEMDRVFQLDLKSVQAQLNALRIRKREQIEAEEKARKATIKLSDERPEASGGTASAQFKPWPEGQDRIIYELPGMFDAVQLAGNGRWIVFHLKIQSKLLFFDIGQREVTQEIALTEDDVRFTATSRWLYIAYPGPNEIERWSLSTFKKVATVKLPFQQPTEVLAAGHASNGPLLALPSGGPGAFLDATTMRPLPTVIHDRQYNRQGEFPDASRAARARASANGKSFSIWGTSGSPAGFRTLMFGRRTTEMYYDHDSMGYIAPNRTGELMFTAKGVFTYQTKPYANNDEIRSQSFHLPSVDSDYSVSVARDDGSKEADTARVNIHVRGKPEPILTLPKVTFRPGRYSDFHGREDMPLDLRVFLFVDAKMLITLPETNQIVAMHRVEGLP